MYSPPIAFPSPSPLLFFPSVQNLKMVTSISIYRRARCFLSRAKTLPTYICIYIYTYTTSLDRHITYSSLVSSPASKQASKLQDQVGINITTCFRDPRPLKSYVHLPTTLGSLDIRDRDTTWEMHGMVPSSFSVCAKKYPPSEKPTMVTFWPRVVRE